MKKAKGNNALYRAGAGRLSLEQSVWHNFECCHVTMQFCFSVLKKAMVIGGHTKAGPLCSCVMIRENRALVPTCPGNLPLQGVGCVTADM